ncbi:unnamed protein product [Sphagnum troendelagicum]|uniref:SET domain-containing protein n=1 Tax=Sphagnum troendelagicum TaxID=128251 RepID=A0ABP0U650_9BRYO
MAMAIFAMATPALSLQPSLPLHNVMLHPCFSTPLRFKAHSGTGIFCVLQQQQQRKEHHDRKRTGVDWGCDPLSLENGTLLKEWLSTEGLAKQKLELERVESGGRGLVAKQSLRQGERLLFVPSRLIITAQSEWGCKEAGELLKEAGVPEWPMLATYLISEASLGRSSHWFPYIATLPQSPTSILQWTEAEVGTWLSASPVRERALDCIRDVTETYKDLQATVFAKHPQVFPAKTYTLEAFKWAFGILFSRLVRMPSLGQLALVPWGDMLNHSPQAAAFLDSDQSNAKAVVFVTDKSYESGEQVFISYGKRSSGELLLAYGFIPPELNPHDFVELELALNEEDPLYDAKLAALREQGLSSPQRFPVRKDGLPEQLIAYACLVVSPATIPAHFSQMAEAATQAGTGLDIQSILSRDDETNAYELILAVCENSVADYSKFLESNEVQHVDVNQVGSIPRTSRHQMLKELAVALCQAERRILYRLQHILRTELRTLRSKSTGDSFIGTYGKKRSNGGLFGLFKWNVDFLEKY